MNEGIRIALDPTPEQERKLRSNAGASRFAFNFGLSHVKEEWDKGNKVNLSQAGLRKWFNSVKEEAAPWWDECSKESFSHGFECLADAFSNYFDSKNGKRKGKRMGFPKFKSRYRSTWSFAYTTGSFGPVRNRPYALRLPKIGIVKTFENVEKRLEGVRKITRMTISEHGGRWYATLTVEKDFFRRGRETHEAVGVDLGVKEMGFCSDETVFENAKYYKQSERKLKQLQRKLARQKKGSKRREKTRMRLRKAHAHVASQRRDAQHKMTTYLVKNYETVCVEHLNVSGMVKNHRLAQAILDVAFYEIRRQLTYKAAKYGRDIVVVNTFYASSKTCSNCGSKKENLTLADRVYRCDQCGLEMDRDLNAAINIRNEGLRILESMRVEQ